MSVTSTTKKVAVSLKLNNGTTTTGAIKTVSVNLGSLNKAAFDAQKAINIVNVLGTCLERSVYSITKTEVSELSED